MLQGQKVTNDEITKLLRQPQFLPLVKYQVWSFQIQKHNKESSIDPTKFLKITQIRKHNKESSIDPTQFLKITQSFV